MFKAVIFDMYETLVDVFAQRPYYSAQMAEDAGVSISLFRRYWRSYEEVRTLGRCDLTVALSETLRQANVYDEALLQHMLGKRLADQRRIFGSIEPRILTMLDTLKKGGIRIGLISNCYLEERDCIRASILAPYFDVLMLSCEQGIKKPEESIFHQCMLALDINADEILYVGDGGSMELESAAACGMYAVQACWFIDDNNPDTPCGRKEHFPHAEQPEEIPAIVFSDNNRLHKDRNRKQSKQS